MKASSARAEMLHKCTTKRTSVVKRSLRIARYLSTTSNFASITSCEFDPTITLNSPGSTT